MPAPQILTLKNTPADGMHLVATLAAPATGPLTFYFSRIPGVHEGTATSTGGPTIYTVAVRGTPILTRLPYYVSAKDDLGEGAQVGQWLCQGSNLDRAEQLESALLEIVEVNKPVLIAGLVNHLGRDTYPDGQAVDVPKIQRGIPGIESDGVYPVVSVRIGTDNEDLYFGNPYTDKATLTGMIYAYAFHEGRRRLEQTVRALGEAVKDVVNQAHYLEIELDCGLSCTACHCDNVTSDEQWSEDFGMFQAVAQMPFSCDLGIGKQV